MTLLLQNTKQRTLNNLLKILDNKSLGNPRLLLSIEGYSFICNKMIDFNEFIKYLFVERKDIGYGALLGAMFTTFGSIMYNDPQFLEGRQPISTRFINIAKINLNSML